MYECEIMFFVSVFFVGSYTSKTIFSHCPVVEARLGSSKCPQPSLTRVRSVGGVAHREGFSLVGALAALCDGPFIQSHAVVTRALSVCHSASPTPGCHILNGWKSAQECPLKDEVETGAAQLRCDGCSLSSKVKSATCCFRVPPVGLGWDPKLVSFGGCYCHHDGRDGARTSSQGRVSVDFSRCGGGDDFSFQLRIKSPVAT